MLCTFQLKNTIFTLYRIIKITFSCNIFIRTISVINGNGVTGCLLPVQILYTEIGIAQITDRNFRSHNTIDHTIIDQRDRICDHFMVIHFIIFQYKRHGPVT